jgi:hypothetical protein
MLVPDGKKTLINEKIKAFQKLPVLKNCYLILGGGKIGTDFLEYARKNSFPFVLVIDWDENSPASKRARVLKTEKELINLLMERSRISFQEENTEQSFHAEKISVEENKKPEDKESEIYFFKMEIHSIPFLLSSGIPEYIIPAVPCHTVAYMLADLLNFPVQDVKMEEDQKEKLPEISSHEMEISETYSSEKITSDKSRPVNELSIRHEDSKLTSFFNTIVSTFPEDVIAGNYPEYGMLFLSYAKEGEICPDGCPGPRDRCPAFGRKKPQTITEYTRELIHTIPGWVFESHQMKPGIGGLKGVEFKQNILEIMKFVSSFKEGISREKPEKLEDRVFFIATTCTCHGVLNLFYVT